MGENEGRKRVNKWKNGMKMRVGCLEEKVKVPEIWGEGLVTYATQYFSTEASAVCNYHALYFHSQR